MNKIQTRIRDKPVNTSIMNKIQTGIRDEPVNTYGKRCKEKIALDIHAIVLAAHNNPLCKLDYCHKKLWEKIENLLHEIY